MVPSQLITVVTPSSSYGFPLCPNPVTVAVLFFGLAPVAPRFNENTLRGARTDPANTPTLPRKFRRFHFELSRMNQLLFRFTYGRQRRGHCFFSWSLSARRPPRGVCALGPP